MNHKLVKSQLSSISAKGLYKYYHSEVETGIALTWIHTQ